jgi:hypothetical protein
MRFGFAHATASLAPRRLLLVAALIWTFVVVAQSVWLPEQRDAVAALRDEALRAQQQARALQGRAAAGMQASAAVSPAEAFRARFPASADNAQRSARLLALGRRHGLEPRRVEFGYSVEPTLGLGRYRVTLPVQGRYTHLRAFVAEALASDNALQLDTVSLRRSDTRSAEIEVQLQFTLLSRGEVAR